MDSDISWTVEMDSDISWTVSGNQLGSYRSTPMPAISSTTYSTQVLKMEGSSLNAPSPLSLKKPGSSKACWTKSVEICSYDKSYDSIKKKFNLPIILTESTASVSQIVGIVSAEGFEGDSVVILDSQNLRILDSNGTKGTGI